MKRIHFILGLAIWTLFLSISFCWNYHTTVSSNHKLVLLKAQSFFEQIKISRAWNAEHGGVYVPISKKTPTNPYLQDSTKDIETTDGIRLTKLNPAYMTRQISEMTKNKSDVQFHITSLKPLRPSNKADEWETKALELFEEGKTECFEVVQHNSTDLYRYMAPLKADKNCLKCHSHQGYKEGDIRGGISISFPVNAYLNATKKQLFSIGSIHIIVFILGLLGSSFYNSMARKHLKTIRNKNEELILSNATKDRFFSIVAHDLKSPFNSIIGYSEILKNDYDDFSNTERKEHIKKINHAAESSLSLLENVLLWSISQQNSIKIKKLELKLKEVAQEAIEPYLSAASLKKIEIANKISRDFIAYIDIFCIKTIIANLVNNSIKYTPTKGCISINAENKGEWSEIVVSDNGVGIPKEILPQLFNIKSEISTPGTQNEKGTGLGLVLCKELIEKNDGHIEIKSIIGNGSKVIIKIPNKFGNARKKQ